MNEIEMTKNINKLLTGKSESMKLRIIRKILGEQFDSAKLKVNQSSFIIEFDNESKQFENSGELISYLRLVKFNADIHPRIHPHVQNYIWFLYKYKLIKYNQLVES